MTPMTSIAMDAVMTATCCACNVELTSQSHRAPAASHAIPRALRGTPDAPVVSMPRPVALMSSRRLRSLLVLRAHPACPPVPRPADLHATPASPSPSPPRIDPDRTLRIYVGCLYLRTARDDSCKD